MLSPLLNFTSRRNGRRRTLLGLVGVIWMMVGWGIYTSPLPNWSLGHLPSVIDKVLENRWSALLWVIAGLVGASAGVSRRIQDRYGFNALLVPAMLWSFLYGWSWLVNVASRGHFGNQRSWVTAVMWLCAVVVLFITSGWPDPGDDDEVG